MLRPIIFLAISIYLLINIGAALNAQSLDSRISSVKQQLDSQIDNIIEPMAQRLRQLETDIHGRDLVVEKRLTSLEQKVDIYGNLLIAVALGVFSQLLSQGVQWLQKARRERK